MAINLTCDGIRRRDFLTVGALGTGLTLAGYLRLSAAAGVSPARAGKLEAKSHAKSAIFINLGGGPSHTDTFDLKPTAPTEYRGSFKPIATKSAGMQLCEHLPKMAKSSSHFALLRSVTHTLAAHELGTLYVNSGKQADQLARFSQLRQPSSRRNCPGPPRPAAVRGDSQHAAADRLLGRAIFGPEHERHSETGKAVRRAGHFARERPHGRRRRKAAAPAGRSR